MLRRRKLLHERDKILQAHFAEAIPLDLLKREQARITEGLSHIEQKLAAANQGYELIGANLKRALDLVTNVQAAYAEASDHGRRQFNQALFTHITVEEDGEVTAELAEPFNILLSPEARRVAGRPPKPRDGGKPGEPDWSAWERSWSAKGEAKEEKPRPRQGGRGLSTNALVGAGGFEPP